MLVNAAWPGWTSSFSLDATVALTLFAPTSSSFFAFSPSMTSATVYSPGTRPVTLVVLLTPSVMVISALWVSGCMWG